jgi:hypothetical protein
VWRTVRGYVGGGWSIFRDAVLEVWVAFSDGPREQIACCFASCDFLPLLFLLALFMACL